MITLSKIDPASLDDKALVFAPVECMNCNFDGQIEAKYFLVTPAVETEEEHEELQRLIKEQLGYDSFAEMSCEKGHVISVSRCPKCGSEEILDDL